MTTAQQSPVTRDVIAADGTEYRVTIAAAGLYIREKRKRGEYGPVSYGWLYLAGAKLKAAETVQKSVAPKVVSRNLLRRLK